MVLHDAVMFEELTVRQDVSGSECRRETFMEPHLERLGDIVLYIDRDLMLYDDVVRFGMSGNGWPENTRT